MPADEHIICKNCGTQYQKDELDRDCGNCFACTGCEIYICPSCRHEIVVKPVQKAKLNKKQAE